ncbi:MAG: NAD-dependent DNA ligase LigA [Candidatus Omnitrophica bacterium]|nr:NAD-dependent DNA ligase LigA [Candidatus Omnitrophota bacterium]
MTHARQAKQEIERLSRELEEHNYRYYALSQPMISDKEYDDKMRRLRELEAEFPDLIFPDSPTQRVGAVLSAAGKTVEHRVKMLSLDNTYSDQEIREWHQRVVKGLGRERMEYVVELKMDGVSVALWYEDGQLTIGSTRGDGVTGEDISSGVKTIRGAPLRLQANPDTPFPEFLDIRGEAYMSREDFERLNQSRARQEEALFANARNATSGALKLLDTRETARRQLRIYIHSFGMLIGGKPLATQWDFLETARAWGFRVNEHRRLCQDIDAVLGFCQEFQAKRADLPYEVDGVVIKVNAFADQRQLGTTLKSPRWAVAYKFPAAQAATTIERVVIQVGRTGVLTPVAELRPVECCGVTISRVTLHNFDEIKRLGVAVGDRVLIERAGDVIPKVVKVLRPSVEPGRQVVASPEKCPECGGPVRKEKAEEVAYRCGNPSCPKQLERALLHFASRGAMDIQGFGEAAARQLLTQGVLKNIADIYDLDRDALLQCELFKEKKADNLLKAIAASKTRPLSRLLFGLGIMNIGEKAAGILARQFGTLEHLGQAKREDLARIREIGPVMAESIVYFFSQESVRRLISRLQTAGVNMTEPRPAVAAALRLSGKKIVFTGELESLTREEAAAQARALGADIVESVSRKTDFVVAGKNPGSKYFKAQELKITILDEPQFKELLDA